jgi:phenylalanyl-tRNA synthetase beta chain
VLSTVARNTHTWRSAIALFEMGPEYLDRGEGLPEERQMLVGAATGERVEKSWDTPDGAFDFYDAKGIVEGLLEQFGATGEFAPASDTTFIRGRCASITVNGKRIGVVGEVAPDIMESLDSQRPEVPMFEIDIVAFAGAIGGGATPVSFETFTRYPESYRDLALLVDESTPADAVVKIIERNRLVGRASIVDLFRGEGVGDGKKSLAVRISYQSAAKTLTGDEVSRAENGILKALEKQLGATRRE